MQNQIDNFSDVPKYVHNNNHSTAPTEHPNPFGSLLQLIQDTFKLIELCFDLIV